MMARLSVQNVAAWSSNLSNTIVDVIGELEARRTFSAFLTCRQEDVQGDTNGSRRDAVGPGDHVVPPGVGGRGQTLDLGRSHHHLHKSNNTRSHHPVNPNHPTNHNHSQHRNEKPAGLSAFILQDRNVYRQRRWLARLPRQFVEEQQTEYSTSYLTSPLPSAGDRTHSANSTASGPAKRGHHSNRRKKNNSSRLSSVVGMTPGSTLMSIGETAVATSNLKPLTSTNTAVGLDVKAWPAFRAYKASLAASQMARAAQRAPKPVVIKAGVAQGKNILQQQSQQRKGPAGTAVAAMPPTFARIMGTSNATNKAMRTASPLLRAQQPALGPERMDPLFPLHLVRLAVLDGEESRACALLSNTFGLERLGDTPMTTPTMSPLGQTRPAPLKAALLGKPKAWPVLLRIWLRALERGMEELLLMLLAAGVPASPLQPLSFFPAKKAPPSTSGPRFYSLAGFASSVSLLSTNSGSTSTTAGGLLASWLLRNYREWLLARVPSFFLAAIAFGMHRLVTAMLEAARKQSPALAGTTWLGLPPLFLAASHAAPRAAMAMTRALLDVGADPAKGLPYLDYLLIRRKLGRRRQKSKTVDNKASGQLKEHSGPSKAISDLGPPNQSTGLDRTPLEWARETPLMPLDGASSCSHAELVLILLGTRLSIPSRLALVVQHDLDVTVRLLKSGNIVEIAAPDGFGVGAG